MERMISAVKNKHKHFGIEATYNKQTNEWTNGRTNQLYSPAIYCWLKYFQNAYRWIGKQLNVKYQCGLTWWSLANSLVFNEKRLSVFAFVLHWHTIQHCIIMKMKFALKRTHRFYIQYMYFAYFKRYRSEISCFCRNDCGSIWNFQIFSNKNISNWLFFLTSKILKKQ